MRGYIDLMAIAWLENTADLFPTLEISLRTTTIAILLAAMLAASAAADEPGYRNHAEMTAAARSLAELDNACGFEVIGLSRQGRGITALTLSERHETADRQPALLIVAGLDGSHLVGSETAMRVASNLLAEQRELLSDLTIYVIPRVNPDGAEFFLSSPRQDRGYAMRAIDEDRDGSNDEDGPDDLNGDGVITMMRRLKPPLDDRPTHLADPAEARLLRKPDALLQLAAIYTTYSEGIDNDGDGRINEDPPGGVDLDQNFMHRWREFAPHVGPYQLSEPESHALATFVLEHPNIVAAITYGLHDNLVHVPDGKGKDESGRAPKDIDPGDVNVYKKVAEVFKDVSDQKRAPKRDSAGAFHAWLYAQRGVPSFATVVWGQPDPTHAPEKDVDEESREESEEPKDNGKPADEEAARWLNYIDIDRNGEGFIDWQAFDHPTLGAVEIGGFVAGTRINPPEAELKELAAQQSEFISQLAELRPRISVIGPEVKHLADGLWDIRLAIVNEGFLPTATAMARKARALPPTIVRISTPIDRILSGDRVSRSWGIDGSDGRFEQRWLVREPAVESVTVMITQPSGSSRELTIPLVETSSEGKGD